MEKIAEQIHCFLEKKANLYEQDPVYQGLSHQVQNEQLIHNLNQEQYNNARSHAQTVGGALGALEGGVSGLGASIHLGPRLPFNSKGMLARMGIQAGATIGGALLGKKLGDNHFTKHHQAQQAILGEQNHAIQQDHARLRGYVAQHYSNNK